MPVFFIKAPMLAQLELVTEKGSVGKVVTGLPVDNLKRCVYMYCVSMCVHHMYALMCVSMHVCVVCLCAPVSMCVCMYV